MVKVHWIKVGDDGVYAVNSTIVNVTVSKVPTEIIVLNDTLVLSVCDEIASGATLTPPDAGNLSYSISNSSVVKMEDGKIIALAEGEATITVSFEGNKKYLEAENKTISVTVKLKDAKVTVDDLTLDVYDNDTISPVTSPEGLEVEYISGNISIVEVDANGVVTAYNAGNTTITVTTKADGIHAVNSTTVNVTVNKINSSLSVEDIVLDYGETTNVNVTCEGAIGITAKLNGEEIIFSGYSVPIPVLNAGNYNLTVTVIPDENHKSATKTVTMTVLKQNTTADISIPQKMTFGENSTVNVKLPDGASGNVTLKVDGAIVETVELQDGSASLNISELSAGNHTVEVSYSGDDNYNSVAKTTTITVDKKPTNITADGFTTTYNINKNLVVTLTDCEGNPLIEVNVTVELSKAKNYTTDKNGQVKVEIGKLTPNTYVATITFKGNENYTLSNATANLVIKKATPKRTVKTKTFKTTTKTKKYTITLKDNKGNPIKNTKVYLKGNGITYTATTNSKGQATFAITKLTKKGTYNAVITYKGNKYYNKLTKKAKITVKQVWKTVSKGSKLKATVKKIQKALKKNGYYISYNGHYLKIDGIYHDCTVRAVKQFQKAKGLKVTGKVDEKTAKKLKLI